MAKLTLSSLLSSFASKALLNNNFQAIEDELNDKVLYRNNPAGEPNQMESVLDMNSNRLINLPAPLSQADALRLADIPSGVEQTSASLVEVADTAGHFDQDTVEGVLEEIHDEVTDLSGVSDIDTARSNLLVDDVSVSSVAALRAGSFLSSTDRIWLFGYNGVGTPGGGPLYRDSNDVSTADDGETVFVDVNGVRWKRPVAYGLNEQRSLADLRSLPDADNPDNLIVYLHGRSTIGDGGEGHFRWDSSDLSTEVGNDEVVATEGDGGIYVAPDSDKTGASGAWVRQYSGHINVLWYGAKNDGDPASISANNAGIQRAINAAEDKGGGIVFVPAGVYLTDSTLTITKTGVSLLGEGSSQRNFTAPPGSLSPLGGSEIVNQSTTAGEYALDIVLGTRGAEGYANLFVRDITIGVGDASVHGVRILGCQHVMFNNVRIVADKNVYDEGTAANIGLTLDDAIVSTFRHCDFRHFSVGIQSEALFNENVVERCNFEFLDSVGIRLRSLTGLNSRATIRECNFRTTKRAVQITGECEDISVRDNTFEGLTEYVVLLHNTDVVDSQVYGTPETVNIEANLFINCSSNSESCIRVEVGTDVYVGRNIGRSSPAGQTALILGAAATELAVFDNKNDGGKPTLDPATPDGVLRVVPIQRADVLTANSGAPSVANRSIGLTANSSATNVSSLLNGYEGQVVTVVALDTNTTLRHAVAGAGQPDLLLQGGVDFVMGLNDTCTLALLAREGTDGEWFEIGRKT